jgi:hypothetical protein
MIYTNLKHVGTYALVDFSTIYTILSLTFMRYEHMLSLPSFLKSFELDE